MAKLVQLTNPETNESIYPQTPIKAIINTSGSNLSTVNGILKGDGAGNITAATAGTDYLKIAPVTSVNGQTGAVQITADNVGAVPTTRTINGLPLSSNITLTASDVNAASESISKRITLQTSAWSSNYQAVSVPGMTTSSNIIVTAAPESYIAYAEAGVRCTEQGSSVLYFMCEKTPTQALKVNILILG